MSAQEPLTPGQVTDRAEAIVRSMLTTQVATSAGIVRQLALAGVLRTEARTEHAPAAGEVEQLRAELADAQALLAKTVDNMTALTGDGELTTYRAEHGGFPLGAYLDRNSAVEHCLTDLADHVGGPVDATSWWTSELGGPTCATYILSARIAGQFRADTGYRVVPLTVLAGYDPDGES